MTDMAAVVKCDVCGAVVKYQEAVHIRVYNLSSATAYNASHCKYAAEVCSTCEKRLKSFLNIGGKE